MFSFIWDEPQVVGIYPRKINAVFRRDTMSNSLLMQYFSIWFWLQGDKENAL